MPAPITIDGPYRPRRARVARVSLLIAAALLVATPFIASALAAYVLG